MNASYILPIKTSSPACDAAFTQYLKRIARKMELILVDGSPPDVFKAHGEMWGHFAEHVPPRYETPMGKVGGVMTGVELATHDCLIVADDDVRYAPPALRTIIGMLERADVVRPQNYFYPLPWHARWDTGRILLARATGGDWPGTLGVRRSALLGAGGYRGDVMFENLELVRTVRAAGGIELVAFDLFVRRLPPTTEHFWTQRVRQAYDELARPTRLAMQLSVLPLALTLATRGHWRAIIAGITSIVVLAEAGRRRGGGSSVFSRTAALWTPLWLAERAVTSWLALGMRLILGGIFYRGDVVPDAASPMRELRRSLTDRYPHPQHPATCTHNHTP
jgi:hypothetical protein